MSFNIWSRYSINAGWKTASCLLFTYQANKLHFESYSDPFLSLDHSSLDESLLFYESCYNCIRCLVLKTGNCCGTIELPNNFDFYHLQCGLLFDRHSPKSLQQFWIFDSFFCFQQLMKFASIFGISMFFHIFSFRFSLKLLIIEIRKV